MNWILQNALSLILFLPALGALVSNLPAIQEPALPFMDCAGGKSPPPAGDNPVDVSL